MTILDELRQQGILATVAELFAEKSAAGALIKRAGMREAGFRPFGDPSIEAWWEHVFVETESKHGRSRIEKLIEAASATHPGNEDLARFRKTRSNLDALAANGGNIRISIRQELPFEQIMAVLDKVEKMAESTGKGVEFVLGYDGSSNFSLSIAGAPSDDEVEHIVNAIQRTLAEAGIAAEVAPEPHRFRDYYSDPLEIEGPDGQRFAIDRVRASTRVSDVARGVMHEYADQGVWPTRAEQKTQAVIDKIDAAGGSERLDPRQTLHDAGVRPGDTLRVSPERTAGAINPLLRDEALARVRNAVLVYSENHPGFAVEANSLVAPTEYLFRFEARSFGPPISEGAIPTCVDRHEVYVRLLPDFPIKAPEAWWQTEIFHPNVDARSGKVCLGALDEHWRPAMDFGELCQMLVDMAAYRNYTVSEGYNRQAAEWAVSPAGQIAIERIGGISLVGRMVMDGTPERRLHIRKLWP